MYKTNNVNATLLTVASVDDDNGIHGVANSLTMTRSGIRVTEEAGKKVVGKKVGLLAFHNWDSLPIGSATMQSVDDDGLHYDAVIFQNVPDREQILEGIRAGVLAVSIGFLANEVDQNTGDIGDIDLLELSVTPVPADSKATIEQSLQLDKTTEATEPDNSDDNSDDDTDDNSDDSQDDTTLADIAAALKQLQASIDKVLTAVEPDEGDDSDNNSDDDSDSGQPGEATETLDKLQADMLSYVMTKFKLSTPVNVKPEIDMIFKNRKDDK